MNDKPNVFINPNAPQWLNDMLDQVLPDANKVRADEIQQKLDDATAARNIVNTKGMTHEEAKRHKYFFAEMSRLLDWYMYEHPEVRSIVVRCRDEDECNLRDFRFSSPLTTKPPF